MVNMATMPLTWRHVWITYVASLGQLIGTGVATLAGIIIPMLNILSHPELSAGMQGLIGAADLVGIVIGSVFFGRLSDRYGYLVFFRLCPAMVAVTSVVVILFPNVWVLIIGLFIIGLGIGAEYSLDSGYISELMPVKWRSTMIGFAKANCALGNIVVAGVCWYLILFWGSAGAWPKLMWIVTVISGVMFLCRIKFWESPMWLLQQGRTAEAEKAVKNFLGRDVEIEPEKKTNTPQPVKQSAWQFMRNNWDRIVLSGIPWACEGLGVYGIGVFLPILVMSLGIEHVEAGESAIHHVASSVETTFFISCVILPGFLLGIWRLMKGVSVSKLQTLGFWASTASLVLLIVSYHFGWNRWISIGAFMAFELFLNMGPHLTTYVLPPKIYTVEDRGMGSGLAASLGKVGAVIAVFVMPLLLKWGGVQLVLWVSAGVMALGAIITMIYSPKVMGVADGKGK